MADDGTLAPKERINITYQPATAGQQEQVELPLKLLVLADFKGKADKTMLEEREVIDLDRSSLNHVMSDMQPTLDLTVADKLSIDDGKELGVQLKFSSLDDFHPDNIVKNIPELESLLQLREALKTLKGPLGNVTEFRQQLQQVVSDDKARDALLKELNVSTAKAK